MPELVLNLFDRRRLLQVLQGQARPSGIRPGTWFRLCETGDLDILEARELRLLASAVPEVVHTLGLPEVIP